MALSDDSDGEETKYIPLHDGRTLCTHGNGTNQVRLVDAEPSDEAHVYDIPASAAFQDPNLLPIMMLSSKFDDAYVGSCNYLIGSRCGLLFDQYFREAIKEPTAYSANFGREIDMPKLWPNRRLKMKFSKDCSAWTECKVVKFKNMCAGPYSPCTRWFMEIQLVTEDSEDVKVGQLVEMHGLKAAKQHNKTYGVLIKDMNEDGRYTVVNRSGKLLCIKPQNFSAVKTITKEVHRMNVSGGGVLKGEQKDVADKISFEWIDKAEPAWEPLISTLEEDEYVLTLELAPDELKSKQERLRKDFEKRAPSLFGAPDNDSRGYPINTPKRRKFEKFIREEFGPTFVNLANSDLEAFEELLMTEPMGLWNHDDLGDIKHDEMYSNPDALKVMYAVIKKRHEAGDTKAYARWASGDSKRGSRSDTSEFVYKLWQSTYSFHIGEAYHNEPSRAIPWFQESVDLMTSGDKRGMAKRLTFLANAYSKIGLIGKAFLLIREACKYGDRSKYPDVYRERDRQLKHLKTWFGTSDYVVSEDGASRISLDGSSTENIVDPRDTEPSIVLLKPHTQVPPHFGVMNNEEFWDPLPVDLPRPLALRVLPSSMSTFDSNEAKDVFMDIYNGNFHLKWLAGTRAELHRKGVEVSEDLLAAVPSNLPKDPRSKFLVLEVYINNGTERVMRNHAMFMKMPRTNQMLMAKATETNGNYRSMFTMDQKNLLSLRVIHWSVRLLGAEIDSSIEVYHICNFLKQEYPKFSNWKDAVDVSVIQTDFVHKRGQNDYLFHCLNGLGEAMEAAKQFEAAAKVYAESAKLFVEKGKYSDAAGLFQNGGLAYRRCESFQNAESLYVNSLHYQLKSNGNKLNLNDDSLDTKLTNMFVNYDMWLNEKNDGTERTKTMHVVFSCLLFRAGFQARRGGRIGFAVKTQGQQMASLALNDRCKTRKHCHQALRNAFVASPPLVSMFHNKILECKSPRLQSVSFTPDTNNNTAGAASSSSSEKAIARDTMVSNVGTTQAYEMNKCCNLECGRMMDVGEIKYCVCRKVTYCSKDCQRAHWKAHKKICSTKQGKK